MTEIERQCLQELVPVRENYFKHQLITVVQAARTHVQPNTNKNKSKNKMADNAGLHRQLCSV